MGAPFSYWQAVTDCQTFQDEQSKLSVQNLSALSSIDGTRILDDVDLEIDPSSITAIIGFPDSGKTELLNCIHRFGALGPTLQTSGRLVFDNSDTVEISQRTQCSPRKIGWVGPQPIIVSGSVHDNVAGPLQVVKPNISSLERDARVVAHLERVGLWPMLQDRLNEDITELPKDDKYRVSFARVLAHEPDLIVMHESTLQPDHFCSSKLEELMERVSRSHAILLSTDDLGKVARLATKTAYIEKGRILEYGDTEDVFLRPKNPNCEEFIRRKYI